MNEFTKEELKTLFLELHIAITHWGDAPEYKHYSKLKEKIQLMIDGLIEQETCNHYWMPEKAELLLQGYDVPLTPVMNKIKCSLCGVPQE